MRRWLALRLGWGGTEGLALFLQAVLFGLAFSAQSVQIWLPVFSLAALINLWAWIAAMQWRRAIVDTPTSRIASAAQGYVELIGVGQPLSDTQLLSPYTQLPCLWYRYVVERRRNGEWRHAEQGESDLPFNLEDESGRCEVDPAGAQILTTHKEIRTQGDQRQTEYVLLKGDRIYALGEFVRMNGAQVALNSRIDVGELLGEWKNDPMDLQRRFDLDRNGAIDENEWRLAQLAAKREVERRHQAIRNQPTRHLLRKPRARKPFLIANHAPEKLGRRYAWFSGAYLVLMLGCLLGIGWAMRLTS